MSSYQYPEPSIIERISVRKTAGGGARCLLFARDDLLPQQAETIRKTLNGHALTCVASEQDNRHCLEVRGCKDIATLEHVLRSAGTLSGVAEVDNSDNEKFSLKEFFRNNMVAVYGVMNIISDVGMIAYGHMKKKLSPEKAPWEDQAAGYAYSVGSVAFTTLGRGDKSDFQACDIARSLRKEFHDRGIELAPDSAAVTFSTATRQQNVARQTKRYLSKHGAEAGNIATGTAGAFILKGALRSDKSDTKMMDGVLGATTMLSGYGAALVKEKAPDPEHPPTTQLGAVKQWIQEKPNRLAGYGYMGATVMHGIESIRHFAKAETEHPGKGAYARKAYAARGAFAGLNLVSEFVLAAASKGHGSGVKSNASIEETAIALVADAIVRQPKDKRDELIRDMGRNFLASKDVLGGDAEALEARLYERVHKMESNPWLAHHAVKTASAEGGEAVQPSGRIWADDKVQKAPVSSPPKLDSYVSAVDNSRSADVSRIP